MNINEYQELASRTINKELNNNELLINAAMGLCGESGEVIDVVKKWYAHGHELDNEHLIKELGNVAWYLAVASTALGVKLEDVLKLNIEKLEKRYPDGFSKEKSIKRDKLDV